MIALPCEASPPATQAPLGQQWVHKRNPQAWLVEDVHELDGDVFTFSVRPGARLAAGIAVVAEVVRQVGLLVSHGHYGVPVGSAFAMEALHVAMAAPVIDLPPQARLACSGHRWRRDKLAGMVIEVEATSGGHVVGRGGGTLNVLSAPVYRRLRQNRPQREAVLTQGALAADLVGCTSPRDVLLGCDETDQLSLVVDTRNAAYYDHPVDHVPGMVLVEAALQAHHLHSTAPATAFEASFDRYAELEPASISTIAMSEDETTVEFHQAGQRCAQIHVSGR